MPSRARKFRRQQANPPPLPDPPRVAATRLLRAAPAWLPAVLAWVALVACYLAALAAISNGMTPLRIYTLYDFDTLRPWMIFRDLFMDGGFAVTGWNIGNNRNLVDYLVAFPVYGLFLALGLPATTAVHVGTLCVPLVFMALLAWGWTFVAREALGKRAPAHATIVLTFAVPPLLVGLGLGNWFSSTYRLVYHFGSWVLVPWLVWLTLRSLRPRQRPWGTALALLALVAFATSNSRLTLPWFTVPAITAVALAMLPPIWLGWRRAIWPLGAIAGGYACGSQAHLVLPFGSTDRAEFSLRNPFELLGSWLEFWWVIITENILLGTVLLVFLAACAARSLVTLCGVDRIAEREGNLGVLLEPVTKIREVVATHFVAVCMWGVLFLSLLTGYFSITPAIYGDHLVYSIRTYVPLYTLPMFVGWALIPWLTPRFVPRHNPVTKCALTMCVAPLLLLAVNGLPLGKINPFATDFKTCLRELATTHGWQGVISTSRFVTVAADPASPIRKFLPVGIQVRLRDSDKGVFYLDHITSNKNMYQGEFNALIATSHEGYTYWSPPSPPYSDRCHVDDWDECYLPNYGGYVMNIKQFIAGFGQPQDAYECDGVAILHYDPPLVFDLAGDRGRLGVMVSEQFVNPS